MDLIERKGVVAVIFVERHAGDGAAAVIPEQHHGVIRRIVLLAELQEEEKDLINQLNLVGTDSYIISSARENYAFLKEGEIRFEFSNPGALYTYSEEELRILVDEVAD